MTSKLLSAIRGDFGQYDPLPSGEDDHCGAEENVIPLKRYLASSLRDEREDQASNFARARWAHVRRSSRWRRWLLSILVLCSLSLAIGYLLLKGKRSSRFMAQEGAGAVDVAEEYGKNVQEYPCCNNMFPSVPTDVIPIKALQAFNAKALDRWISKGQLPDVLDFSKYVRIDGITLWVNGSDPRHKANREHFSKHITEKNIRPSIRIAKRLSRAGQYNAANNLQNSDNHYRELNELLYNVRSSRASLNRYLGTHHVISTDFWDTPESSQKAVEEGLEDRLFEGRRGQIPQWLDTQSAHVGFGAQNLNDTVALRIHHDWEVFAPFEAATDVEEWKMERLPTFSSTAAEAVLGTNVPGLSEIYFLSSDDMFVTGALSTGDFYTPLYGSVLHLEFSRMYHGNDRPNLGDESTGIEYTVGLLSRRFGTKHQSYPAHMFKSQLLPLVLESKAMFKREYEEASRRRFRGDGLVINSHAMSYGLIVERHREALLWSLLIAKLDVNGDGILDEDEFSHALRLLGTTDSQASIPVKLPHRSTLEEASVASALKNAKFPPALKSEYRFSSFDGYPYIFPDQNYSANTRLFLKNGPPKFLPGAQRIPKDRDRFQYDFCHIDLEVCLPRTRREKTLIRDTDTIFKHFAFVKPECGNCLVMHFVGLSGSKGLEAFLPSETYQFPLGHAHRQQNQSTRKGDTGPAEAYHLPLTNDWRGTNFSLTAVAADNRLDHANPTDRRANPSRRMFAVELLSRYSYVIGHTPSRFEMLRHPSGAKFVLDRLTRLTRASQFSYLCINDDIADGVNEIRRHLQKYFTDIWPDSKFKLPFEKTP